MSFGALNIDVALQISNKILFEEFFSDALSPIIFLICFLHFSYIGVKMLNHKRKGNKKKGGDVCFYVL